MFWILRNRNGRTNKNLHKNNERLMFHNKQLTADNNRLKEEVKDYKLLRKVFGHKQIDSLLEQARSLNSVVHALETKIMKGRDRQ